MGIFKNLFKGNKKEQVKKPDIDALLASKDSNGSIIELDNYICELCEYGQHLERLSEPQRVFYFNQELEREINSGGFSSFFYYSYANYFDETIASLKSIGAFQFAALLQDATTVFPNNQVPKDLNERQELVESFAEDAWKEYDDKFYAYPENLNKLNLEYVRKHKDLF